MQHFSFETLKPSYTDYLTNYPVRPEWQCIADNDAKRISNNRDRYQAVSDNTGVPWYIIGVIHLMEANLDFDTYLGNGDPLFSSEGEGLKSRHVPAGRGPFDTWEAGAIDALKYQGMQLVKDWSDEQALYQLEKYNGFGYRDKGHTSPYLTSGTTAYSKGKYVSDGKYDPDAISGQIGAIPVLLAIKKTPYLTKGEVIDTSRKAGIVRRVGRGAAAAVTGVGSLFTMDQFNTGVTVISQMRQFIEGHALWIVLGIGATVWIVTKVLEWLVQQDYADGRYVPSGAPTQQTKGAQDANTV